MKDYRYRVWDTKENKYVFGTTGFSMYGEIVIMGEWGNIAWQSISDNEVDRYVLLQYTTVNDANGREIYDGDIVAWMLQGSIAPGIVCWRQGGWWIKDQYGGNTVRLSKASSKIVVGSIYETN